ncbi:MAG: phosphatidylglycerophosphatase A [Desulfobacterales bacterium]|nr:phosphatidylglycerophosphatase A [Desulfobacterales bacterium]
MQFRDKAVVFAATGGYVGLIPVAPGTFGTLVGLPLCYLLSKIGPVPALVATAIFIGASVWIAHRAEAVLDRHDPGCIVIDEIVGMAVTLIWLPFTARTAVAGFVLFRLLDILKPPPVRTLDRKLPGGLGVVMDDVAAGMIANLILRGLFFWL